MGLALDTETELFLIVEESFSEEKACEHSQHENDPASHEGVAEWYANYSCFNCGDTKGIMALCDKWKAYVATGPILHCIKCFQNSDGREFYRFGWTRISEKGR